MADCWAAGTCHRGNGRLDGPDCATVDGMCCRHLEAQLVVNAEVVVIEDECPVLWHRVTLTDR